jgi:hypothetical protein
MKRGYKKITSIITPESFNRALKKYNQPAINFEQILLPGESVDQWMQEFKVANRGGYLLHDTIKGARTNHYRLWFGSSKQAVENQNIINIYDALREEIRPRIVNPTEFHEVLQSRKKLLVAK